MAASEADIDAGRLHDFDLYLARITRDAHDALAEKRRRQAAAE